MNENQSAEILLVEDNPNDIELELRAFKKHNMIEKIFVVKDGAEALDYLFGTGAYIHRTHYNPPRVIVLDLKLPKVHGLEVLKKVKSDIRTKRIPVIILTASNEERDLIESYKLGVNSYMTKPVDFEKFIQAASELGLYQLLLNKLPQKP